MYTIVIADDEKAIRKSLIHNVAWSEIGFQVVGEAENGAEALELVEKLEPDLLLTDIKMPFITGIELARQVRKIRPMTQIAFLSGYDEFTYAQQAIQYNIISYILKPITLEKITEELIQIRKKMEKKYQEFLSTEVIYEKAEKSTLLLSLLLDDYSPELLNENTENYEEWMRAEAVDKGLLKADDPQLMNYVICVTMFIDEKGKNCTADANVNAVDTVLKKYFQCSSIFIQKKIVSLLIGTERTLNKYLTIAVEEISQSVDRIMGLNAVIGVSKSTGNLTGIHKCYQDSMKALSNFSGKKNEIHFIADEERMGNFQKELNDCNVFEVEELIRGGSDEQVREYLNRFFEEIGKGNISQPLVQYTKIQMIAALLRVISAVGENEAPDIIQEKSFSQIMSIGSGRDDKEQYIELFLRAKKMIKEQRRQTSEIACGRAVKMINEQYMNSDLSLVEISSQIGLSPNYFGALFKKEMGISFKEFLTQKRMEVAKELLSCTGMKIWEVAVKSGYSEQHYFSYCFKKYTGESPNAYRRRYEEQS